MPVTGSVCWPGAGREAYSPEELGSVAQGLTHRQAGQGDAGMAPSVHAAPWWGPRRLIGSGEGWRPRLGGESQATAGEGLRAYAGPPATASYALLAPGKVVRQGSGGGEGGLQGRTGRRRDSGPLAARGPCTELRTRRLKPEPPFCSFALQGLQK